MAVLVNATESLGGWSASTLEDSLVQAQYTEAVMTLPRSHPAYKALMSNVFKSPGPVCVVNIDELFSNGSVTY